MLQIPLEKIMDKTKDQEALPKDSLDNVHL
jgi:hypothetical protein